MFYGVKVGRKPGVYKEWSEAQKHVIGFPNPKFRKFVTESAAANYVLGNEISTTAREFNAAKINVSGFPNPKLGKFAPDTAAAYVLDNKTLTTAREFTAAKISNKLAYLKYEPCSSSSDVTTATTPHGVTTKSLTSNKNLSCELLPIKPKEEKPHYDPKFELRPLGTKICQQTSRKGLISESIDTKDWQKRQLYSPGVKLELTKTIEPSNVKVTPNSCTCMCQCGAYPEIPLPVLIQTLGQSKGRNKRNLDSLGQSEPPKKKRRVYLNRQSPNKSIGTTIDEFEAGSTLPVNVYTDGACAENGRVDAHAGIGVYWGPNHPMNVSEPLSGRQTNNRAEIMAAVRALDQAKSVGIQSVILNTDSRFLINGITKWVKGWKKNGWKLKSGGDVKNRADFEALDEAQKDLNVEYKHVLGHRGNPGNEAADRLAVKARDENIV